jgi:hypothetical protein
VLDLWNLDMSQFCEHANTVPHQSGAGPAGKVQQLFETRGYDHQHCYNEDMLMLTLRLIVRIVQGLPR